MRRLPRLALALAVLLMLCLPLFGSAHAQGYELVVTPTYPLPGATIYTQTPVITAKFTDNVSTVVVSSVQMRVGRVLVTNVEGTVITTSGITYTTPPLLKLPYGLVNVTILATDEAGYSTNETWNFTVAPAPLAPATFFRVNPEQLILYTAIGTAIFAAVFGGWYLYVRQTRRFAFRKYFATHPIQKEYLVLYIPMAFAFIVALVGLAYVFSNPGLPWYSYEAVFVAALWVGLLAYAIDARREKRRLRAYERAYAQLLFEMADAMRGGLDPAKTLTELATTHTDILQKPLRIAADGIRIGRPFEQVMREMARPMRSPLITRYAGLIAEASTAGGQTAIVVHRAAKDMDDFIKIEVERANQLALPVAVLYIAFGILMGVLFALLYIAPSLGSISISLISGGPLTGGGGGASTVPKLNPFTLREDFLYLSLIISVGTGVIIGAFTEGQVKYGLVHSLGLALATLVVFALFFPG